MPPREPLHLSPEPLGLARVVAVGHDDDGGARIDHARRVPAVEVGEAFTDPRAAADALRHQREAVDGALDVALAQRARHMDEACVEDERLRLAEGVDRRVQEACEEGGIELHRT